MKSSIHIQRMLKMSLCALCLQFNIRDLLLQAGLQIPRASGLSNRNRVDPEDYRTPIPQFFAHHRDIVALKISAEQGCSFCSLIWYTWAGNLTKTDYTEEWLAATFQGQIYIGSSGWTTSKQGMPYITISQQTSAGQTRAMC